jgi:hypothetical protein
MLLIPDTYKAAFTLAALTLVLWPTLIAAESPEVRFESALHSEIVSGDLAGAMDEYRAILSQQGTPRPVAAKALLEIGRCQEKLGQRKEAYNTYRRLVAEFGDQPEIVKQANLKLAAWSGPRNLKFEEGVAGKAPPGWFVPSLPKDADYLAEVRRDGCRAHDNCAVIMVPLNVPRPVGNLMQSFSAAAYRGKTVRMTAWLRVESLFVAPAPAVGLRLPNPEDRAQMWMTVERANRKNGFSDNMDDRPVRSQQWTRCEITGTVDEDAQFVNFGFISIGGGRVWIDDVSFDVIPERK